MIAPRVVDMPEIHPAYSHMRELFFYMGQVTQESTGIVPVTWAELKAFLEVTELEITLWERQTLKKMSEAYCMEYSRASDPDRPAPYKPKVEEAEVDQVGKALQIMQNLSGFKKLKGKV